MFTEDNRRLCSDNSNDTFTVWDTTTGEMLVSFGCAYGYVMGDTVLNFRCEKRINTTLLSNTLILRGIYAASELEEWTVVVPEGEIVQIAQSRDGALMCGSTQACAHVGVWNIDSRQQVALVELPRNHHLELGSGTCLIEFHPLNVHRIMCCNAIQLTICEWEVAPESCQLLDLMKYSRILQLVKLCPDKIETVRSHWEALDDNDDDDREDEQVVGAVFTGDGRSIVVSRENGRIAIHNYESGCEITSWQRGCYVHSRALCCSPESQVVLL